MCVGVGTPSLWLSLSDSSHHWHHLSCQLGSLIGRRKILEDTVQRKYAHYKNGNKLLTINQALETITTRIEFVLRKGLKTWWPIDVSKNTIE